MLYIISEHHSPCAGRMDWTKVIGLSVSSTGSVGVLFVEFPDGVVVLKSSDKNFSETLGMVLSAQLAIPTINCRVVYKKLLLLFF